MVVVFAALSIVSMLTLCLQYICVFRKKATVIPRARAERAISVLKPLKGLDDGLYENLTAMVEQEYSAFEVLFGAEDPEDPALEVARRVRAEHPDVQIKICAGSSHTGLNPKVRVLRCLLEQAEYDWVLISDSNVRPDSQYLRQLDAAGAHFGGRLVHNVLVGVGGGSIGARLENLQMNGWVAGAIAICDAGGHPIVVGKSMMMHRADLESVGGLESVRDVLAEDYVLGAAYRARGYKVVLSPYSLRVVSGARNIRTFLNRHIRWGQLRRRIAPHYFVAELLGNPTPFLIVWAVLASNLGQTMALSLLGLKWMLDVLTYARLDRNLEIRTLALLPFKDCLVLGMWFLSAMRTRVSWRGHQMRIGAGSRLVPEDSTLIASERRAVECTLGNTSSP